MIIVASILILIVLVGVWLFNRLVSLRQLTREAWSGIDVQLKRRHDLVPMIVTVVKGYATHEKQLFEDLTRMRSSCANAPDLKMRAIRESELGQTLKGMMAVAENYPDLKANQNFLGLQHALAEIENQIQFARRYYNGTIRDYNIAVQTFPGLMMAGLIKFAPMEFFELAKAAESFNPEVKL